jgi:ribonuclease HI
VSVLNQLVAYTDGSCKPNPGKGAFSFVLLDTSESKLLFEHGELSPDPKTTNNRMELQAIVSAISVARQLGTQKLLVVSDSLLCLKGVEKVLKLRERKGYPQSNQDLWRDLRVQAERGKIQISIKHVKGHSKNYWNVYVDKLCSRLIKTVR